MDITALEAMLNETCIPPARVALVGTGNYLRADDFLGVQVIQNLKEKVKNDSVLLVEAETAPSDFVPLILEWKPTHLIVLDAAAFGVKPGSLDIIKREEMATYTHSSHKKALTLLIDLVTHYLSELKLIIIGVQPATIDYEIGLSPPIQDTVDKLTTLFTSIFSRL